MVARRCYPGKRNEHLTEEVKAELREMAGLTNTTKFETLKFSIGMIRRMLRIDAQCDVEERISRLRNLSIHYVADGNLEGIVEEGGL